MAEAPTTPVKDRALRLLGVRSRSREEIRQRLLRAGYHPSEIEAAIEDLEAAELLDDERFAREVAARDLLRRRRGRRAALLSLRKAGVDRDLAERVVAEIAPRDELPKAEELARDRAARVGGLDRAAAYRRVLGFLQRRGYDPDVARTAARRALSGAG